MPTQCSSFCVSPLHDLSREERVIYSLADSIEAAFSEEMTFDLVLKEWENFFFVGRTGVEEEHSGKATVFGMSGWKTGVTVEQQIT